jgi:hypothetical protein
MIVITGTELLKVVLAIAVVLVFTIVHIRRRG